MSNVLTAKERTVAERSVLKKLRDNGQVPAVVYGNKNESKAISFNNGEFLKTLKEVGRNGIISLDLDGKKHNVMLKDYQSDPLKQEIFHADFLIINMSAEIEAQVKLNLTGEAKGVKNDRGVLQQPVHEVSVTAKPKDIPESIDIDISELEIGDSITFGDIKDQYDVTINLEDDLVLASVLAPRQEEPDEDAEETVENEDSAASDESQAGE